LIKIEKMKYGAIMKVDHNNIYIIINFLLSIILLMLRAICEKFIR